jgi:hypothetical protein
MFARRPGRGWFYFNFDAMGWEISEEVLAEAYFVQNPDQLQGVISGLWRRGNRRAAARLLELTRRTPRDGLLDAADGLVCAGLPLPETGENAAFAMKRVLAGAEPPTLPSRTTWPQMAGPTAANWHFLYGRLLRQLGRDDEARIEFQQAGDGGNVFAWMELMFLDNKVDMAQLQNAAEAGDAQACGLLALSASRLSGAVRQRLLEFGKMGAQKGNLLSIIGLAKDLAARGRRKGAAALLRRLEREPLRVRGFGSADECEALEAAGRPRAARRLVLSLTRIGHYFLDSRSRFIDSFLADDPDSAGAFLLMQREKLAM